MTTVLICQGPCYCDRCGMGVAHCISPYSTYKSHSHGTLHLPYMESIQWHLKVLFLVTTPCRVNPSCSSKCTAYFSDHPLYLDVHNPLQGPPWQHALSYQRTDGEVAKGINWQGRGESRRKYKMCTVCVMSISILTLPHLSLQSTVNEVQVVDFLTGKGVSKEEAMEVRPIICVIPAVT